MPSDRYAEYYSAKLWAIIPAIYRTEDSAGLDEAGPLRELVGRIAGQAAVLRRSIDRLWEDQSIESCDDWVVPYIGDLLATNLVASLDARGQRLDVAKTIYYRRRKGTLAVLEEIAADTTGWETRVVEFFRRLGRTRHGLDPAVGLSREQQLPDRLQRAEGLVGAFSKTAVGGQVDLRNRYAASRAHTAFDEYYHFADVRRPRGGSGWHNILRLGVFVWRLQSFGVRLATPVAIAGCPDWYTFDPTGRDVPLFAAASRARLRQYGDAWVSPEEAQLPGPIDDPAWNQFPESYYPDEEAAPRSLGVYTLPGIAGYVLTPRNRTLVLPGRGRFKLLDSPGATPVTSDYYYGFSAGIGAGPHDRRTREAREPYPDPKSGVSGGGTVTPINGTLEIGDSLTYATAADLAVATQAAVAAANEQRPVLRPAAGSEWRFTGSAGAELILDGLLLTGGSDIVLEGEFQRVTLRSMTLDPGLGEPAPAGPYQAAADGRPLAPCRLMVEGTVRELVVERSVLGPVRTRHGGIVREVRIADSILQAIPSAAKPHFEPRHIQDATRLALRLKNAFSPLAAHLRGLVAGNELAAFDGSAAPPAALISALAAALNSAVAGPKLTGVVSFEGLPVSAALLMRAQAAVPPGPLLVALNYELLKEALPLELADAAIGLADGLVHLDRVTVLGRLHVNQLEASECILSELAWVENPQRGCVRFSAWAQGSVLPRKYESVTVRPGAPLFTSREFGSPGYAQLLASADRAVVGTAGGSIREGAQNGSEMGAFWMEKNAIKERSLLLKFEEYMPLGLDPVVIHVT